ncbi:MAG: polysaccharide biosynthesis tyrosine autokinase [Micropruina sp.]
MELSGYLKALRKYWRSALILTLSGFAAGALLSVATPPTYTARASVFLTVQSGGTAGELNQGSTYAENQVRSYARVVLTSIVLQPVIDRLALGVTAHALAQDVTATVPINTAIIEISVVGTDPTRTATVANEIARQTTAIVEELSPSGLGGAKSVQATVISPASVPGEWTTPKVLQNVALLGMLGVFVGVGQSLLRNSLDTRVLTEGDIAEVTDSAVIGSISFDEGAEKNPLMLQAGPHSLRAENYRRLRTNLQFLGLDGRGKSLVITSSVEGEGKSTTAINIAIMLAEAGKSVLLIDADLRRPRVASYLNLEGAVGLTTVIIGHAQLKDVVQPLGNGNLHVLTAGQIPPNPSELLGSEDMKRLLGEATDRYDVVVFDSPPLLPVTDAAVLTTIAGGALVVVGSGAVLAAQLAGAVDTLDSVGGHVFGVVLNKLRAKDAGHYSHHSYYHPDDQRPSMLVDGKVTRTGPRGTPISPAETLVPDVAQAVAER